MCLMFSMTLIPHALIVANRIDRLVFLLLFLWKNNRFFDALSKKLTRQVAEKLLKDGKAKLKGCRSVKTGKTYDTTVVLTVGDGQRVQFSLSFEKGGK